MSPLLAKEVPFTCPKCRYVALDRTSLIRHFATRHGLVDAFLKVTLVFIVVEKLEYLLSPVSVSILLLENFCCPPVGSL